MKIKTYLAVIFACALSVSLVRPAHADESKETIKFTFSGPVHIPGKTLPAGTYIFETLDADESPDVIEVFNADHTELITMLQTVPVDRMKLSGDPAITLAKQNGGPEVLVDWFYGDRLTGHEFMYSKQEESKLAQAKQDTFIGDHLVTAGQAIGE